MIAWCDTVFPEAAERRLRDGLAGVELRRAARPLTTNLAGSAWEPGMVGAEVAFGQPGLDAVARTPTLRWVHLTSAGWTRYEAGLPPGVRLTTSSTVYADPCAEHALAALLAASRCLPDALDDQRGPRAWPAAALRARSRLLRGSTVVLLGYGAIGRRLAALLAPFEARVVAFRRRPRGDEGVTVVDRAGLDAVLPACDHLVDLLPGSATTDRFVDAGLLARLPPDATFTNVGRGTTVDEAALLAALDGGRLRAAWLDVAAVEPLPGDHPFWSHPRVFLTPHAAGGRREEPEALVAHFLDNLARYRAGAPLRDEVGGPG